MKKIVIILAAAMIAVGASAQVRLEGALSLGNYNKSSDFNSKAGFIGRVLYDFSLGNSASNEAFFLSTGAGFVMNNTQPKGNDGNFTCNWLQVPVTFGSFYPVGTGNLYASLGLYYAYALSGKITNGGVSMDVLRNSTSAINVIKPHDFGGMVQIGYVLPINIGLYVGYNRGFINIAAQDDSEAKNKILEFGLLYKF